MEAMSAKSTRCVSCQNRGIAGDVDLAASIPPALCNLTPAQQRALQPLLLSQGESRQHRVGYRRRDKLSWQRQSVPDRIKALAEEDKPGARAAFACLLSSPDSAYTAWLAAHGQASAAAVDMTVPRQAASAARLRLPFGALLEPYVDPPSAPSFGHGFARHRRDLRRDRSRGCTGDGDAQRAGVGAGTPHRRPSQAAAS